MPRLQPGLFDELVIDNFAGGGGASLGMEWGLGRAVDIAINHDREAMAMHEANHPYTTHLRKDVWSIDPVAVCKGRPVGLAWFSPDCKHFSKAKGGKPVSRDIRDLAWVVIRWAMKVRPRVIMLENVEEFQDWGPLVPVCADAFGNRQRDKQGNLIMRPCKFNTGRTFYHWVARLKKLGYQVDWRVIRACDYGAPTIRRRLFLIARCDGMPIVWPKPTHGNPKSAEVKKSKLQPWRTAAECIDWSLPCPSIFERKKPLAEATLRRIAKGIMRYVVENKEPFIVTYYGSKGDDFRGQSIGEALATQTTENRHALVEAFLVKHYTGAVGSYFDAPVGTITSVDHHSIVTASMIRHFGESVGSPADAPAGTITAGGMGKTGLVTANLIRNFGSSAGWAIDMPAGTSTSKQKDALVTSHLIKLRGTCRDGQPVTRPMPTVTGGGLHVGEVRAFLLKYYGSESDAHGITDPLGTVTTKDRFGLVIVHGEEYQIVDIGLRMLSPRELYMAQGFTDEYIIDPLVEYQQRGKRKQFRRLSKTAQVRMCGNSVSPWPAAALVRTNVKIMSGVMVAA